MDEKVRLLFLGANPLGVGYRLRLDKEVREITRGIRSGRNSDLFDVRSEWAVRPGDLFDALAAHDPHIVHISGHATRTRGMVLEADSGRACTIDAQALVGLLGMFKCSIRLVFFNLCHTERHVALCSQLIDYAVGITSKIGDEGAIIFSSSFYKGLALGLSVKSAFDFAMNQMALQRVRFSRSPILRMREGITEPASLLVTARRPAPIPLASGLEGQAGAEVLRMIEQIRDDVRYLLTVIDQKCPGCGRARDDFPPS
jgi:hypothetical protein